MALRFLPAVNLFAASRDDSPAAGAALAELVKPGETIILAQVPDVRIPPGLTEVNAGGVVQMLANRSLSGEPRDVRIRALTEEDAPEMLALAKLTEPGPFLTRTHTMGSFLGIRIDGRLAAMAGERMRFPGYTELSGVCTHPDFRGRGLARALSTAVTAGIEARGDRAFLHAWKNNRSAIGLYETLGFELRAEVNVAVLTRTG